MERGGARRRRAHRESEGNHYFPAESLHRVVLRRQPHHQHLPVEGPGPVLPRQRGRHGQPGCGLVLPAAEPCCQRDRRACRVLAWGAGGACSRPRRGKDGRRGPRPGRPDPGPGCTGQGRGREPGSGNARRRAGALAARMPVLRDAAAGAAQCPVPATWVNIWEDRAAAARVRAITGGDETVPTVEVGAGPWLTLLPGRSPRLCATRSLAPSRGRVAGPHGGWHAWLGSLAAGRGCGRITDEPGLAGAAPGRDEPGLASILDRLPRLV